MLKGKRNKASRINRRFIIKNINNFSIIEAYNSARANLMFSLSTKKKKTVVITSNSPGEGKSSTSINLAITFAKTGAKILLIDSDLRKPSIQALLGIKNKKGFSSLIGKFCTFEEAVNRNVVENLDVICSGPIPPNPAELLTSAYVSELISFFNRKYDYVFIDTPPIGVVSDALLLNYLVAGIVFVVRQNSTTHNDIKQALRSIELAKGNLLGFLEVDCNISKNFFERKYSRRKYRYGDNYGYGNFNGSVTSDKESGQESVSTDENGNNSDPDGLNLEGIDLGGFSIGDLDRDLDKRLNETSASTHSIDTLESIKKNGSIDSFDDF